MKPPQGISITARRETYLDPTRGPFTYRVTVWEMIGGESEFTCRAEDLADRVSESIDGLVNP